MLIHIFFVPQSLYLIALHELKIIYMYPVFFNQLSYIKKYNTFYLQIFIADNIFLMRILELNSTSCFNQYFSAVFF